MAHAIRPAGPFPSPILAPETAPRRSLPKSAGMRRSAPVSCWHGQCFGGRDGNGGRRLSKALVLRRMVPLLRPRVGSSVRVPSRAGRSADGATGRARPAGARPRMRDGPACASSAVDRRPRPRRRLRFLRGHASRGRRTRPKGPRGCGAMPCVCRSPSAAFDAVGVDAGVPLVPRSDGGAAGDRARAPAGGRVRSHGGETRARAAGPTRGGGRACPAPAVSPGRMAKSSRAEPGRWASASSARNASFASPARSSFHR
jgi:hypothetical protein